MARPGRARAALVVVTALCPVLAVTGCGVPDGSTARVEAREVPFGLLAPVERGGEGVGAGGGAAGSRDAAVAAAVLAARDPGTYLLDAEEALVAVPLEGARSGSQGAAPRTGPVGDEEATVLGRLLLRGLAAGPSRAQREEGLSTALGPGVPVRLVEVVGGTARVELRQPDRDPAADRLPLAVGQVVLTVTSAPGVDRVQLLRDGVPTAVPLPSGARWDEPVRALDYAVLLAAAR